MRSKTEKNNALTVEGPTPPVEQLNEIIAAAKKVMVISHMDPDGDSLGTTLAFGAYLKSLGKEVYMLRDGDIPHKYHFIANIEDVIDASNCNKQIAIDTAVILECPNVDRIGVASKCVDDHVRVINIDHHRDNDIFGELNWINTSASSVGEMAFEYFERVGFALDKAVAEQLFVAIMTDTGRFRYRSTSGRTMEIAGKLIDTGIDPQKITDSVYYNMRPSTMILTGKVLNNIKFIADNKGCILSLDQSLLDETGADMTEADGFVDFTLFSDGVVVGAFVKEIDKNRTKVSLRSKEEINVAEVAARFGGGGHYNAAGFTLEMDINAAIEKVTDLLNEVLHG